MELEKLEEIHKTYNLFVDEESRYIFKNRLMYNLLGELEYIRNVIRTNKTAMAFLESMLNEKEPVAVWGAGIRAEKFLDFYPEMKIECFIDSYRYGQTLRDIKIIKIEDFVKTCPNTRIVILPRFSYKEIVRKIIGLGIEESRILNFAKVMEQLYEEQYFDLLDKEIDRDGIFVDGGCLDGNDSLKFFRKFSGGGCQLWEPNQEVIPEIIQKMKINNIPYELIQAGMSDRKGKATANYKANEMSAFSLGDGIEGNILLDCIDNHAEQKISMIKMDIEGFEHKGLLGAKWAIQQHKPVLAICVYHRRDDLWKIPLLIHSICSDYRFYMKHYSLFANETVLYGICHIN
ncbi:FkbM family methyltransferase [Parablautia intestinalis]|uniref:FkbM family methyltransferase n=1 Tax=Parablautia intestinalis TaxID=2320100 RepID=A0A3A9AMG7_9FIRM|nr:FkbM family methyltransferase [Parablautia intestinalis]RKI88651.1 FkbM family methyltransferase [Parablautia intestinalis]